MSELKLEDLKVGDKLEFISDEEKRSFLKSDELNKVIFDDCLSEGVGIVERVGVYIYLESSAGEDNNIGDYELKYFKKVEQVEDIKPLEDVTPEEETPYVLVDAGIKDYVESYTRQMAGERFMFGDKQMWFDPKDGNFMCDDKLAGAYKSEYRNFKVKKPWYNIASGSNPILCKVWDEDEFNFCYQRVIFKECGYHTEEENIWENATPVKASECFDG